MPSVGPLAGWTQLRKITSDLEHMTVGTSETRKLREKDWMKQNRISKNCGTNIHVMGISEGEERKEQKKYLTQRLRMSLN